MKKFTSIGYHTLKFRVQTLNWHVWIPRYVCRFSCCNNQLLEIWSLSVASNIMWDAHVSIWHQTPQNKESLGDRYCWAVAALDAISGQSLSRVRLQSLEYHALLLVLLHWVVGGSAVDLTNQIKEYLKQKISILHKDIKQVSQESNWAQASRFVYIVHKISRFWVWFKSSCKGPKRALV